MAVEAPMSSLMIEAQGLTKRCGPTVALGGIDLAPGGLSLTWSEVIFSDAPTVLDILRPREVRDALLTR
jgi:hypothetical protein